MNDKERYGILMPLFKAGIIDQLKQAANASLSAQQKAENEEASELYLAATPDERKAMKSVKHIGVYTPSADALKTAAFAAWNEIIESEQEVIGPMLAVAVWEATLKVNESAFRQGLERLEKAGTLGFKVGGSAKAPSTIAGGYLS